MKPYKNLGGDSNVTGYEIGLDFILVQFGDFSVYEYTYSSAGRNNIERMKRLAVEGKGLNGFINQNVRKKYSRKIR